MEKVAIAAIAVIIIVVLSLRKSKKSNKITITKRTEIHSDGEIDIHESQRTIEK